MSLSNTTVKQTFQGDGVVTAFAIPFSILVSDTTEADVYIRDESDANSITETLQVEGALQDYTLTGAAPPSTPFATTVTFNTAPVATSKIIIIRNLARTQTLDIDESGDFPAESLETSLDRIVAQVQSLKEELDRIPKLRISEQFGDTTLGQSFANYLMRVNNDNDGFEFVSAATVLASATASGFTGQVSATILDSQTSTDVTGLLLDKLVYSSAVVFGEIVRGTDGGHIILSVRYVNSAWVVKEVIANTSAAHGLTWNITSGGQVQYTSGTEGAGTFEYNMLRYTV